MPETPRASVAVASDPGRILLVRFSGHVRSQDLNGAFLHPAIASAYEPGTLVINDLCDAVVDTTLDEMRATMGHIDAFFGRAGGTPGGGAIIAPMDVTFGLARMYKLLTGDAYPTLEVFRTWDDAIRWLELDPAEVEALVAQLVPIELGDGGEQVSPAP